MLSTMKLFFKIQIVMLMILFYACSENRHAYISNQQTQITPMKKIIIQTDKAPAPIGPYSQAVMVDNILFVSGQVAIDPATGILNTKDITIETTLVMKNIKAILNEAGMDFSNIVKTTIFLKNMDDFAKVNEIYGSNFAGDFPARETVQVSKLPKDANVEITVTAVKR